MKRLFNISTVLNLVILISIFSCGQHQDTKQTISKQDITKTPLKDTTYVNGNVTTTISEDIDKLSKLLDFKTYKPTRVVFKYVFIDNSGQNERMSVPGPSDYSLQALMYFDSLTFEKFYDFDRHADYPSPNYNKEDFKFDWLNKEILTELENSNPNYHGHPDFFFGTTNGKSWYLDKKILIQKWTN
jgi:hypothetical protein